MSNFRLSRKPVQDVTELEVLRHDDSEPITQEVAPHLTPAETPFHDGQNNDHLEKHADTNTDKISPLGGAALLTRHSLHWHSLLMDVFVIVSTLPFFALAGTVAWLGGRTVQEDQWRDILNGTRIAATLFPIVFAATAGRLLTKAASWKLERGSKLGLLEQLMSSKTVFATISTQFSLGTFNILGIGLISLWVLSPLGGQSALRIIETSFVNIIAESPIAYFSTDGPSRFVLWTVSSPATAGAVADNFVRLNAMYNAVLLTPASTKQSGVDLWNNVKIPYLSSYESQPAASWSDIPLNSSSSNLVYSSLVGIPMFNIPRGNSSFLIESSYMELDCTNITSTPSVEFTNATYLNQFDSCGYTKCVTIKNGTFQGSESINRNSNTSSSSSTPKQYSTWAIAIDTFVNTTLWKGADFVSPANLTSQTGIDARQATLLFQSADVMDDMYNKGNINYTHAYCKVNQRYVESRVNCSSLSTSSRDCAVVAQRQSQLPHAPDTITHLSWPQVFKTLSSRIPRTNAAAGDNGLSDLALYHIQNATSMFLGDTGSHARFDTMPLKQFSQGLGQILNSYLLLSQTYTLATMSTYVNAENFFPASRGIRRNQTSTAVITTPEQIYVTSSTWLRIFGLSVTVLLISAIASVVLSHMTTSPEVLGSCSLLVRSNKYIDLPSGGGTLDGIDMTKALKHLNIRAGQVKENVDGTGVLGVSLKTKVSGAKIGERYY